MADWVYNAGTEDLGLRRSHDLQHHVHRVTYARKPSSVKERSNARFRSRASRPRSTGYCRSCCVSHNTSTNAQSKYRTPFLFYQCPLEEDLPNPPLHSLPRSLRVAVS